MKNRILRALLGTILLTGLSQAQALTITFSDLSSDATPVSSLGASLDFTVTAFGADSGDDLLTLTLESLTTDFTIDDLYFNFTGDESLISFDPTNSGLGALNLSSPTANGFGTFDAMIGGFGLANLSIEVWQLDLGATGISMNDFNVLSTIPPGETPVLAALKFTMGPDDPEDPSMEDSAFGAATVVPVPAAVWLFGSGLLGLVGVARRKA